jgi:hypothetical protein
MVQLSLPKSSTVTEGKVFIAASGATLVKTFSVYRWNPDDDSNPRIGGRATYFSGRSNVVEPTIFPTDMPLLLIMFPLTD